MWKWCLVVVESSRCVGARREAVWERVEVVGIVVVVVEGEVEGAGRQVAVVVVC